MKNKQLITRITADILTPDNKRRLIVAVLENEVEFCFDKGYLSDEFWGKIHKNESREQAFKNVVGFLKQLMTLDGDDFIEEFDSVYGDQYDSLLVVAELN